MTIADYSIYSSVGFNERGFMKSIFEEFGYSKFDVENKVIECWNNIFDQNNKNHFYHEVDNQMGFMEDTGNNDARTEGMSYGMMMAVQMNRKDVFDRIWKWTRTYMYLKDGFNAGFFSWSNKTDGSRNSDGPAPDGEEYFALALFFAAEKWGDGEGIFEYSEEARKILKTAIHGPSLMWNTENYLIRFVCNCPFSDPSYHLPHFYEVFAKRCYPEDREFWVKAAKESRKYLKKACNAETGLAAEYAEFDGSPLSVEHHGTFFSDSYRVAANIGLDALWFGKNADLSDIAEKIIKFFDGKTENDMKDYLVTGKELKKKARHPIGLIATVAEAALAVDDIGNPSVKRAVERLWNTPMREGKRRYYDNCLYFFAILALSGHYQNFI